MNKTKKKITLVDSVFIVVNYCSGVSELGCTVGERVREREVGLCIQGGPSRLLTEQYSWCAMTPNGWNLA